MQLESTAIFVDLTTCYKYPPEAAGLFYYQWVLLRVGVGVFEIVNRSEITSVVANSFSLSFLIICLLYFSDPTYLSTTVTTLLMIDQWRLALGLTSLLMSMFTLNKYILIIQAVFLCHMIIKNGLGCLSYLKTTLYEYNSVESQKFMNFAFIVFSLNAIWYISAVINEYLFREKEN